MLYYIYNSLGKCAVLKASDYVLLNDEYIFRDSGLRIIARFNRNLILAISKEPLKFED